MGANDGDGVLDESDPSAYQRATTVRVIPIPGSNAVDLEFGTADARFKIGPFDAAVADWLTEDYLDHPEWFARAD